jgi:hypothetical protein
MHAIRNAVGSGYGVAAPIDRDPDGTAEGKQVLFRGVTSPLDQTSHPQPTSSMVTKLRHHAAVVDVRAGHL